MSLYGDLPVSGKSNGSEKQSEWSQTSKSNQKPEKESIEDSKQQQVEEKRDTQPSTTAWNSTSTKFLQQALARKKVAAKPKPRPVTAIAQIQVVGRESTEASTMQKSVETESIPVTKPLSIRDSYDPARPNDYDEIKEARERKKKKDKEALLQEAIEHQSKKIKMSREADKSHFDIVPETTQDTSHSQDMGKPKDDFSPIVVLVNLVAPWDIDPELEAETKEECEKFGPVSKVIVYQAKNVSEHEAVRVYVEFRESSSARQAIEVMNGRFFGGRQIRCITFPLNRFLRLDLKPKPEEMVEYA